LDVAPWGQDNGGSLDSIGVAFPVRGGGWGAGNGLFPQARCDNCEEVGVPNMRCGVRLKKKKNGVKAFGPRVGLWGHVGWVNKWV